MAEVDLLESVPPVYLQLAAHERVLYSPTLAGELYDWPPEIIEAQTAIGALTGLVNAAYRARQANELALSWRNYRVGASAYMCNFQTGYFGYLDGFNVKPQSGQEGLNLHAEQIAVAKGRLKGLNRLMGIAVYADPFNDDANPNKNITLRVCSRCVGMFEIAPEVDERTLILGTNPDFTKCELYTFGSLLVPEGTEQELLVPEPFALATEDDLEYYDRRIQPYLVKPILEMYAEAA